MSFCSLQLFNQSIDELAKCTQLEEIDFGDYSRFNQPIEALSKCTQLKRLSVGINFDQPTDELFRAVRILNAGF